jgi:4-hydroxybenzoate polyprenyltransferase
MDRRRQFRQEVAMSLAAPPDSEHRGLIGWLPASARPFALLARFDRPIGWWLLFWPCAWGLALVGGAAHHWPLFAWFLFGAVAMRGAGCVYNDIVDRDLDARVARTALRPLASGAVSLRAAWVWLILLCVCGLVTLLQLSAVAQMVALASLALVALYPFMKRITWWPQIWLGLVFGWGALVGAAAVTGSIGAPTAWLYAGTIAWIVGYDTLYALQDVEDDALAGIKSSARAMGRHVRGGVALCYALAIGGWAMALWVRRPEMLALAALIPAALHLVWQVATLRQDDGGGDALAKFRSNRTAGLLVFGAMLAVGSAG